jgi:hypothetical protein
MHTVSRLVLVTGLVTLGSTSYAAGVPKNAVMFFAQANCPTGWAPYTDAQGRAIVGIVPGLSKVKVAPSTLGGKVGTPLRNMENRQHLHRVDPSAQATSSTSVPHTHAMNHGHGQIGGGAHRHRWIYSNTHGSWFSFRSDGNDDMMSYQRKLDPSQPNSGAFAVYGLPNANWYTESTTHDHEIPQDNFTTSAASNTSHTHSVDIPASNSDVKRTGDVMPYIQLTACIKS